MKKKYQIAIDGPAGSGKSTIAKIIANKLNFLYIDSGAMYRATTLYFIENNLLDLPKKKLKPFLKKINILFKNKEVFLNNKNVSKEIRSSIVANNVSKVSAIKPVREKLVTLQRGYGKNNSIVMDGRDIGSVVFPNADLKIYLTASCEIRAKRRIKDLKNIGEKIKTSKMIEEIQFRDNYDSSRKISPLTKAQDAIVIDTSKMSIDEVTENILYCLPQTLINPIY